MPAIRAGFLVFAGALACATPEGATDSSATSSSETGASDSAPDPASLDLCQRGRIAVPGIDDEISYEDVAMPSHSLDERGMLVSDRVRFSPPDLFEDGLELPIPKVDPGVTGDCAFDPTDERFLYVHTFIHAERAIALYNEGLVAAGFSPLPQVEIRLGYYPDLPATGFASGSVVDLDWSFPELDPGLIAHELGHVVDEHVGAGFGDYSEGAANLYAALALSDSTVSQLHHYDAPKIDVDRFEHFDSLTSSRDVFEQTLAAVRFWEVYAQGYREELEAELATGGAALDEPDAYVASSLVSQPLWHLLDDETGRLDVLELLIRARAQSTQGATLSDAAQLLTDVACDDDRVSAPGLRSAYRERGIRTLSASC